MAVRFKALFLFSLLCSFAASGQEKISAGQFKSDLGLLVKNLEAYYPGLYYYESKAIFDSRLDSLRKNLSDSLTILDAYKQTANFVSGIGDLHLGVGLPKKYFPKDTKVFPLILRKFQDKFYVHYNESADSTLVRGTEVLSINDLSTFETFKKLQSLYGSDNFNEFGKNYYAEYHFQSFFSRWYGVLDSAKIEVKLAPDSSKITKELQFLPGKTALKNLNSRYKNVIRKNLDLERVDSLSNTYKLDVVSFSGDKKGLFDFKKRPFKKKLKLAFKEIKRAETQHLVLDLRGNGGGAVANVHRLLSYLLQERFNIYDSVSVSKAGYNKMFKPIYVLPNLGARLYFNKKNDKTRYRLIKDSKKKFKPNKKFNYKGDLYILMNGGSYSATAFTISLLNHLKRGTFVGTPPGGANWGSFAGQFYKLKLPESKVVVRIPLMTIVHDGSSEHRENFLVKPTYFVEQSFEDFLVKKDTQLEFILNKIRDERN